MKLPRARRHLGCWLAASGMLHATAAVFSLGSSAGAAELLRDFDGDGVAEKLLSGPGVNEIHHREAGSGAWVKADYALPEGVALADESGQDAGLRFADLNGDGHGDILFSNPARFAIHLWTKNVQPHLGWTRGWSQFVRAGERTGAVGEPASIAGAEVRLEEGMLVITRPARDGQPAMVEKVSAPQLIAYDMPPPKSPEEALASFRVADGFRVELVAAEPVVIDPVAFDWGADGRLWVVEMRDYPLGMDGQGKPGGVVKMLEDVDGDGRYEQAVTFLDNLPFPTGVLPWRKGVLISAAPDILYAEDADGDSRADIRKVLFTGFNPGNQQHRFNGFEWGLDGWVYAANGDSGGKVRSLETGKEISISGRDVRFRPDSGEIETVSAQTQFGLRRDDWGNWFGNNNPAWLWQVMLPEHYLRRNPKLAVTRVRRMLANYEDSTRVFPISVPMVRPNQPWSLNHVTSGCSPAPYRDELFGPEFADSVFISEPVHNAVHREVLERDGSGFASRRAAGEERREFLASTDNWFRPTTVKTGPNGALYIADMYRFVLEHPEWISPEMQARLDLRAGEDRGRLYRVVPEGKPLRSIPNLEKMTAREWIAALDSPNGWQRDQAMRLLVERAKEERRKEERGDGSLIEPLRELLALKHAPKVRLQALATMGQIRQLTPPLLTAALADPHPAVRAEALRQSEPFGGSRGSLFAGVAAAARDSEPTVRLQAAFTLGAWPGESTEPLLRELAAREDADEWLRAAVQSSLSPGSPLFAELNKPAALAKPVSAPAVLKPTSADRAAVIRDYLALGNLKGDAARGRAHFKALCAPCHRLRGEGQEVGPDLGMTGAKPLDWLLSAILDPSQIVEARYRAWAISLKNGESVSGIISAETANNLVVRIAGGIEQPVLRGDIAALQPQVLSLMPAGFESALQPQDMADLLRWLREP